MIVVMKVSAIVRGVTAIVELASGSVVVDEDKEELIRRFFVKKEEIMLFDLSSLSLFTFVLLQLLLLLLVWSLLSLPEIGVGKRELEEGVRFRLFNFVGVCHDSISPN